ncbi:oligoendopeptidase F [Sporanaerobium hydrogeniformans]|uniref:Oligoendopeptidase F n=1 Tax=Sporanaerobium hydrogeniformans TaxID=3072179 RepID=A0AC61DBZ6_9FIRM|nr:M3 family oligoendopeptidase [Sporanaerobium hydrogeniformans]PHV70072.1 oligoendopeptidase F [Sporanaerobium hydrogeniformans]
MELNWSLKELYTSFEEEAFKADMKKLDELIAQNKKWVEEHTVNHENEKQKLEEYITLTKELLMVHEKLSNFASLTVSIESQNETANKIDAVLEEKISHLASSDAKMSKWISEIKELEGQIAESDLLKEHAFYLHEAVKAHKHMLSEKEEAILARMQNTGSSAWVTYKNLLIATHKVELELKGEKKELPLTEVLNLAYEDDKETRKKAYEAELASYKKIEEGVAAALNAIKGEVLTITQLRKYTSPLEMTLEESRMDRETLDAMLEAIKEKLPSFRKYLRAKAKKLGYEGGLPFYELYAPVVDKEMKFPYEKGTAFVEKNFYTFSKNLGDFAKYAIEHQWIDVMPKAGKVGGAFCAAVHSIGESRVMLNYGNNLSDVVTMAHELGHGFHDHCLKNESILNINLPMSLAETASNFCETIIKKAALEEADKEERLAILETEISDSTQVIVDIYSRFLFESAVFDERKKGPLSVKEINEYMLEAQKEAYGEGLDSNYLHPYMWTWKPHYYYADANFYNFPYAFGLLFAKGLYNEYLKDKEGFPERYEHLLEVTGKMSVKDVLGTVNIDASDKNFWLGSLEIIEQEIEEFIQLIEEA